MKILRVTSDLYPYVLGGIGLHAHNLSIEQYKNGCNITVFTCISKKSDVLPLTVPYTILNFGKIIELCGNTVCFNMFRSLYHNRRNYDVIDAHSHLFISTNLCALVRRLGSVPLVITNHGLRSQNVPKIFQELYLRTLGVWTFNSADKIITFTEYERNELLKIGVDDKKIVIIPNAIDTDVFYPNPYKHDKFTVIWVGRLSAGKGLKYGILGFEQYLINHPNAQMYVVGDGPYYCDALTYVSEKGLDEKIIFTGRVENQEMLSYYNRSDVYLMTSMSEGFPRTLLEAAACGLSVICTDIPQLIPIVERCGVVIPKKNIRAVADALDFLSSDLQQRQIFCKKGREFVVKHNSLKQMSRDTEQVYFNVIAGE